MIWRDFVASLMPRSRRKLIGEDYYGTKYYEEPPRASNPQRPPRYFVPVTKNDFEQEMPAEWESWLRYRRKDPPTQEEIESNYQLAITKKKNAEMLAEKYSSEAANGDLPVRSTASQSTLPGNFPTYPDYKHFGKNYRPKDPYKED